MRARSSPSRSLPPAGLTFLVIQVESVHLLSLLLLLELDALLTIFDLILVELLLDFMSQIMLIAHCYCLFLLALYILQRMSHHLGLVYEQLHLIGNLKMHDNSFL